MMMARTDEAAGDALALRECETIEEFEQCVALQRSVFGFPDIEVSPRRHFIVSRRAGGWTLGAFDVEELVGFVHHLAAVRGAEVYGYSHMLAVKREYQNRGVGAQLKWAQRERALKEGRRLIRWTWDPLQARNAHFNLNRLGVVVRSYAVNFYGTDYSVPADEREHAPGLDSDRLFAEWELDTERVVRLARGEEMELPETPAAAVSIPPDWTALIKRDAAAARCELLRVRAEFQGALKSGLVCRGFARDPEHPRYLFYR
ncbi:MAG: GNAT family N-acetyltransferase [Acidobacteria bacterium]|nr:GNAT family N-acetyltransferase [Acidobacteriota bacterium]